MEYPLLSVCALLSVLLVATSHAALPPELYWKSVLPTTPMPKAITDILYPDWVEEKSTNVGVGKGGVNVDAGKGKLGHTKVDVGKGGVNVNAGKGSGGGHGGTNVNVGGGKGGGVSVHTGHKQNYPYAVFYCHKSGSTRAYSVPLEGDNGVRVKAVAVCRTDTSQWNPKHLAFQVLKVKPGTVPVCHFLPEDHVVWVSK
uniref:BURP domain-containing protein n=1 Tax=Lotus japonicus TaxID=34305 RepID=I3SVL8_LOTJA|nr:unknown [Lotus japonicus]